MNLNSIQLDKQKKILIVIFSILIIYVDSTFILKSQTSGIKSSEPKITRLKNDLINLNRSLDNMRAAQGKQGVAVKKVISKSSKILSEGQVSGLLQDIASQANKFDIQIGQIRPVRETVNAKNAIAGDKFTPILINLDLTCNYHNLGKFVNELENSLVFLSVQELVISTQLPDYMKQKVKLVLKTYVTK